jgi:hypothetical protein
MVDCKITIGKAVVVRLRSPLIPPSSILFSIYTWAWGKTIVYPLEIDFFFKEGSVGVSTGAEGRCSMLDVRVHAPTLSNI